jgi:serine protease Do
MKKSSILIPFVITFLTFFPIAGRAAELPDFTQLVAREGAAVVNISTTQIIRRNPHMQQSPFDDDDPTQEFFRRFFPGQIPGMPPGYPGQPREYKSQSLGSGFIISADGHILTNAHVVSNATRILIRTTNDPEPHAAKIVHIAHDCDLALVEAEDASHFEKLKPLDFGGIPQLNTEVIAIGYPIGGDRISVTRGVVSRIDFRPYSHTSVDSHLAIQVDAAINPGNSGGALVNLNGQLVGINSAILSRSGGNIGIGFAIPSNMMKIVMNQLIKYGTVKRGVLGVNIQTLTPDIAKSMELPDNTQGALVSQVVDGSAAEKAGIKAGDVITAVLSLNLTDLVNAVIDIPARIADGVLNGGYPGPNSDRTRVC